MLGIANALRKKMITFKEVPFNYILDAMSRIYIQTGDSENYFAPAFGQLLVDAVEAQNINTISLLLELMAKNAYMMMNNASVRKELKDANYRLKTENNYLLNCERIRKYYETHTAHNTTPFEGKGVIYSAVTGEYDDIKEPEMLIPRFDYVLFTDNDNIKSDVWKIRKIENPEGLDNVRLARKIKIMGHEYLPEYDFSIWIDGKMQIIGDMEEYVRKYRQSEPMLCFNHFANDCVYMEKEVCLKLNKDCAEVIEKQMERYKGEGYPEKNGMIESCVLVRDFRSDRLKRVMEVWWNEIKKGSFRDQLSFNYACWKEDFVYDTSRLFVYGNDYVKLYNHKYQ